MKQRAQPAYHICIGDNHLAAVYQWRLSRLRTAGSPHGSGSGAPLRLPWTVATSASTACGTGTSRYRAMVTSAVERGRSGSIAAGAMTAAGATAAETVADDSNLVVTVTLPLATGCCMTASTAVSP